MIEGSARGAGDALPDAPEPGRARRLLTGWSANLFQMVLGVTQQVALIPVFLHYWSGDVLAAWLAIYAAGNLILVADAGLQLRSINRFLGFRAGVDCDGRTASFYAAMLWVYLGVAGTLIVLVLAGAGVLPPSTVLGFQKIPHFDAAFVVMTTGMLLILPSNLASGLYRARGLYGRAVRLQNYAMLFAQLAQLAAIVATGSLLAVTAAYVGAQLIVAIYLVTIDAPRVFPFLRGVRCSHSWRWIAGQFGKAAPFAVAGATELALINLPVLLVSALVSNRMAVVQWGLTRIAAGLLRTLCFQTTLPLAAELGHDHALGLKDRLQSLYAHGSVFVALLASVAVSGLLSFWPDFFVLWTHGTIPYDSLLTVVLLIGASIVAPSILALGYASYSNRGGLLARTKGLQLAVFLVLAVVLIPAMGSLGAAVAIVASDILVQFGLLGLIIIRQTLQRPAQHVAFIALVMILVTAGGWALGATIRSWVPGTGLPRFALECALWLAAVAVLAVPLVNRDLRDRLIARIPK